MRPAFHRAGRVPSALVAMAWVAASLLLAPGAGLRGEACAQASAAGPGADSSLSDGSAWAKARRLAVEDRHAEALEVLRGALARNPDDTELLWLQAGVTGWSGKNREAVVLYEALIARHPEMAQPVVLDLAKERMWSGDARGALRDLDFLLARAPDDREAARTRALALAFADRLREAREAYERLLAEDPGDSEARMGYARVLNWQGHHREAARRYRELLADGVDDTDVLSGLAQAEYWSGRPDRARAPLRTLLDRRGHDPEARALAWHLDRETRPTVFAGFERGDDSDGLGLSTGLLRYRQPLGPQDAVVVQARGDAVEGASSDFDLRRVGLGHERVWSDSWESHVYLDWQLNAPDPLQDRMLGDGWITARPVDGLRFDVGLSREQVRTPTALSLNVLVLSAVASGDWRVGSRWGLHAEHRRNHYSDDNDNWFSELALRYRVWARHDLSLDAELSGRHLASSQDLDHGYYDPHGYVEGGPGLAFSWEPHAGWTMAAAGRTGWQKEKGSPAEMLLTLEGRAEVPLGRQLWLGGSLSHSDSNLSSDSGYERTGWSIDLTTRF